MSLTDEIIVDFTLVYTSELFSTMIHHGMMDFHHEASASIMGTFCTLQMLQMMNGGKQGNLASSVIIIYIKHHIIPCSNGPFQ